MSVAESPLSSAEQSALVRAVELADLGAGTALPNPVVGCVVLDRQAQVAGEGWHRRAGEPHAEINALSQAGQAAAGGTAVVTLEPCNHTGRTGRCSQALRAAGVRRVVVAVRDATAAGGGIERLRTAGIDVVDLTGTHTAGPANDVNRVWLNSTRLGRPFVTFKSGMTIDGRVAAADGTSRWITSVESRADVHLLRGRVDTLMVGIGTVLADDPQLTVRDADGNPIGAQPLRVVVDSTNRTPLNARVVDSAAESLVATSATFPGPNARVELAGLLTELYRLGRRHILLEGGPRLAAAMIDAGLVDEIVAYVAPVVLGSGRQVLDGGMATTLTDARRFVLRDVTRVGPEVRLRWTAEL